MRKDFLWRMFTVATAALLSFDLTACGGTDSGSQDPEGTVVINMGSGSTGNYYDIGLVRKIHIDSNGNFAAYRKHDDCHVEFASVGKVDGLSQVTTPPRSGWSQSIAVVPGHGYMARDMVNSDPSGTYARLYVVMNGSNGKTTVKYQSPYSEFPLNIKDLLLILLIAAILLHVKKVT